MTDAQLAVTKIVRSGLVGRAGERLGQVRDVVALLTEGSLPVISGVVAGIGKRDVFIPAHEIATFNSDTVRLSVDRLDMRAFERRPREILLARDILRHHVINVRGARLVRVKDVELAQSDGGLRVAGIRVGVGTTVGRLLLRTMGDARRETFIDWPSIEPLLAHVPTVRRKLPFTRLARLHPAELADMVEAASPIEGEEIMEAVGEDPELEADVFEELDEDYQVEFLRARSDLEAAEILSHMSPDDAADIIVQLEQDHRERILGRLPRERLQKIRGLLGYNPETAGGLMSPDFLAVSSDTSVGAALDLVRTSDLPPTSVGTIYIVGDGNRLMAAVSLAEILRHDPANAVADVAARDPVIARPHTDIPEIATKMADFNLEALPVVDDEYRIIGVIAVDDLLEVMLPREWRIRVQHYAPDEHIAETPSASWGH
jgi:CBS domain-containing protein/sporulation protein YlmC with PRC-barrel domain